MKAILVIDVQDYYLNKDGVKIDLDCCTVLHIFEPIENWDEYINKLFNTGEGNERNRYEGRTR